MVAPYNPPIKGQDFVLRISLPDMVEAGSFKVDPPIASGDFQVDKDGLGLVNLSVVPVVQPFGSVLVKISLSASEMNADVVTIVGRDQSVPKEWADFVLSIPTASLPPEPFELDVPLVLENDGVNAASIIMKADVAVDGYVYGGNILTKTSGAPAPLNTIGATEYIDPQYPSRQVYIGGGWTGNRDATGILFCLDPNKAPDAPVDGGYPYVFFEPTRAVFQMEMWNYASPSGRYWSKEWWLNGGTATQYNWEIGFKAGYFQRDLVFCSNGAVEQWRLAYSAGSHFLPGVTKTQDIGSPSKALRNIHSGGVNLIQRNLADQAKITTQNTEVSSPPIALIQGGEIDVFGFGSPYPGYRFRGITIGGSDPDLGAVDNIPTNSIAFYCDESYDDDPAPHTGSIVMTMFAGSVSSYYPLTIYSDSITALQLAVL